MECHIIDNKSDLPTLFYSRSCCILPCLTLPCLTMPCLAHIGDVWTMRIHSMDLQLAVHSCYPPVSQSPRVPQLYMLYFEITVRVLMVD